MLECCSHFDNCCNIKDAHLIFSSENCVIIFAFDSFMNNSGLTLILLTCRIWWAPNNASRWQMEFDSAFKGL